PHYPQPGKGRRPVGVERMLRIYFLQQWFNLSDPAVEEALYDSGGMRQFVGIDLGCEPVPDETTVCKFRHLLEAHQLGEQILGQVNLHLQAQGVRITTGTIVDATILHAPTSTKKREQQRDPEMHQTKKGKQCFRSSPVGREFRVGCRSRTAPSCSRSEQWFGHATASVRGAEAARWAIPFPRKFTNSEFTSSACVQVMQCGPPFTTNWRAPLISLAVRSPEAVIGRIRSASP